MCNCRRMGEADLAPAMRSHFAWFIVTSHKSWNSVIKLGDYKGSKSWMWKFTVIETAVYRFNSRQNEDDLFQYQSENMLGCTDDWFFHFHISAPVLFSGIFCYPQIKLHCFLHNKFFDVTVGALFCIVIHFDCKSPLLLSPVFQLSIFSLSCSLIAFFTRSNLWILKENGGLKLYGVGGWDLWLSFSLHFPSFCGCRTGPLTVHSFLCLPLKHVMRPRFYISKWTI